VRSVDNPRLATETMVDNDIAKSAYAGAGFIAAGTAFQVAGSSKQIRREGSI
jgi:hypothetical protein